jgi:hypothetical protein
VGAVLGDPDRDRRQLRDLVALGLADGLSLGATETASAARAALGPMVDDLIKLGLGHELASRALVTRLPTLLTRARRPPGPRSLPRRIGRRRARGVPRVLAQLLLETLDPRLQAGDLALMARRQLDQNSTQASRPAS